MNHTEAELMQRLKEQTLQEISMTHEATDEEVRLAIDHVLMIEGQKQYYTLKQKQRMADTVFNAIRRLDILQELLEQEDVTEIMVIGRRVFYEKKGRICKWEKEFASIQNVEEIIQRIAGNNNRLLNTRMPMTDSRLEDGSRVHMVIAPVALDGPVITIRKFPKEAILMKDLIEWGSITQEAADFLEKLVASGYNMFISGGTGSGKTTFLNALSEFIPSEERVIVIEDTAELQIKGIDNLVRLEARGKNLEGENEITIRQLVRAALRMRPTRVMIGEVRGEEAIDLLQAMNTGHDGSISTGHANSTKDMLSRLETMVMMGMDIPMKAIRNQIASGIDIMIHLGRLRDKSRRVLEISEIRGVKEDIVIEPLYVFQEEGEDNGRVLGKLQKVSALEYTQKLKAAGWGE